MQRERLVSEMRPELRQLPKKFGVTVRELRTGAGLTQMQLAEKADLSLNFVGEIERGEKMVSLETVVRLGYALRISGADLLKRSGF